MNQTKRDRVETARQALMRALMLFPDGDGDEHLLEAMSCLTAWQWRHDVARLEERRTRSTASIA